MTQKTIFELRAFMTTEAFFTPKKHFLKEWYCRVWGRMLIKQIGLDISKRPKRWTPSDRGSRNYDRRRRLISFTILNYEIISAISLPTITWCWSCGNVELMAWNILLHGVKSNFGVGYSLVDRPDVCLLLLLLFIFFSWFIYFFLGEFTL